MADCSGLPGLSGKRALVTGGARGIGFGIAQALYKAGAHVIIADINEANLANAKKEMPNAQTIVVDLSNWNGTIEALSKVLPIQLLVNNAGVGSGQPFGTFTEKDFDLVFSVNIKSVFNISQVVANDLRKRQMPGSIVNMSSIASLRPLMEHAAYSASKSALDGLTGVMTLELGPLIRVNSVHPTICMTEMAKVGWSDPVKSGPMLKRTPLGRFAEIGDVVSAVLFLLSDAAQFLHGVSLPVDGGLTRVS